MAYTFICNLVHRLQALQAQHVGPAMFALTDEQIQFLWWEIGEMSDAFVPFLFGFLYELGPSPAAPPPTQEELLHLYSLATDPEYAEMWFINHVYPPSPPADDDQILDALVELDIPLD
jgi:hypothetical protein